MKRASLVLAGALCLAACSASGPPRQETKPLPVLVVRKDVGATRDIVRQALLDRKIPVDSAEDTAVRSTAVEGNGFSWRVVVLLFAGPDAVTLEPSIEIDRNRPFRPIRDMLSNMGRMTAEEETGRPQKSPEDEREAAIREVEDRVRKLMRDLEARSGAPER